MRGALCTTVVAAAVGGAFALDPVRIGTRGSPLALAQAYMTRDLLMANFADLKEEGAIEICVMKTQGDMILDKALSEIGGKGLFTKELDVALLGNEVDICVHSMKDVPTWIPDKTVLPCTLEREDTRDVFISPNAKTLAELPDGSVIGSASLRRQAQILAKNPTLKCVNFRGNVQTRLRKLDEGIVDATLLAYAGLKRMDMQDEATQVLEMDEMLPAVAQGAIAIQCRDDDARSLELLKKLNHQDTLTAVTCERAFLAALDGNCKTPIAGQAVLKDGRLHFKGLIAKPDGSGIIRVEETADPDDAERLGQHCGEKVKAQAGADYFSWLQADALA